MARKKAAASACQATRRLTPDPSLEPYFREALQIEKEVRELNAEAHRIYQQLAEVAQWKPVLNEHGSHTIDPDTGPYRIRAVERYRCDVRRALEARLREVEYHASLLADPGGERRIARAMKATAQLHPFFLFGERQPIAARIECGLGCEQAIVATSP